MMEHFNLYTLTQVKQEHVIGGISAQLLEEMNRSTSKDVVVDYIYTELGDGADDEILVEEMAENTKVETDSNQRRKRKRRRKFY